MHSWEQPATVPIDAGGTSSRPITGATFTVLRADAAASIAFFDWACARTQGLDYVPLPAEIADRVTQGIAPR